LVRKASQEVGFSQRVRERKTKEKERPKALK